MSRKPSVLITGASGEMGHALIARLAAGDPDRPIVTLDLNPLPPESARLVRQAVNGSILDPALLDGILAQYEVDRVYHLAALLSTRSEFSPALAHKVNVEGTLNMLEFAQKQGESHGRPVAFFYPSSIAAFGLPSLQVKARAGRVKEDEYNVPTTMYGANKLYCEHLGRYYSRHYKQLAAETVSGKVDFRCIRFPGLISAETVPSGGTSDYAPEMIHAAASGQPYACFVRPDTRIPFMAMPDAVDSIFRLMDAPRARLTRAIYNIGAFAPTRRGDRGRGPRGVPTDGDHDAGGREAAGDRGLVAGGRGRLRGAGRLGTRPRARVRVRVRRVPDPVDQEALCLMRIEPRPAGSAQTPHREGGWRAPCRSRLDFIVRGVSGSSPGT